MFIGKREENYSDKILLIVKHWKHGLVFLPIYALYLSEIVRNTAPQKLFVKGKKTKNHPYTLKTRSYAIFFSVDNEDKRPSATLKRKKFVAEESDPFSAPKRRSARVSSRSEKVSLSIWFLIYYLQQIT